MYKYINNDYVYHSFNDEQELLYKYCVKNYIHKEERTTTFKDVILDCEQFILPGGHCFRFTKNWHNLICAPNADIVILMNTPNFVINNKLSLSSERKLVEYYYKNVKTFTLKI